MPPSLCEQLGTLFIYTEACFQSADNSNSLDYEERRLHNAIIIFGRETQGQARAPALPFMWYMGALCPGQDLWAGTQDKGKGSLTFLFLDSHTHSLLPNKSCAGCKQSQPQRAVQTECVCSWVNKQTLLSQMDHWPLPSLPSEGSQSRFVVEPAQNFTFILFASSEGLIQFLHFRSH